MRRLTVVLALVMIGLLGPLAGLGNAARPAVLTSASYVDGQTLVVTGTAVCPAGQLFAMQAVVTQKSGATGAGSTDDEACTGGRQPFELTIAKTSDVPFSPGRITTSLYGGSYCHEEACEGENLADYVKQTFRVCRRRLWAVVAVRLPVSKVALRWG